MVVDFTSVNVWENIYIIHFHDTVLQKLLFFCIKAAGAAVALLAATPTLQAHTGPCFILEHFWTTDYCVRPSANWNVSNSNSEF